MAEKYYQNREFYDGIIENHFRTNDIISVSGTYRIGTNYIYPDKFNLLTNPLTGHFIDGFYEIIDKEGILVKDFFQTLGDTIDFVEESVQAIFHQSFSARIIRRDPIVLDLDGDGLEIEPLGNGAHFDLDRNGFAEETAWVNSDDGLLVLDRNMDGIINDGGELFGDNTTLADGTTASSGFEALAEMDSNGDGIINSEDQGFADLKIWQDANGDGFSQADELKTLEEAGVSSISLDNQVVNKDIAGNNTVVREGMYIKEDGSIGNIGELLFERDTFNTEGNEMRENIDNIQNQLMENPDILFLPDFKGYGTVHSLRYAMLHDVELKGLVESFTEEKEIGTRREVLGEILLKWTDSEDVANGSRGGSIDAKKLAVLESFMGEEFTGVNGSNPNSVAASLLNTAYNNLFNSIYYNLLMQGQMSFVGLVIEGSDGEYDFSGIEEYIDKLIDSDIISGIEFYKDLSGAAKVFGWETEESYIDMKNYLTTEYNFLANPQAIYTGTNEGDNLIGDIGSNIMIGGKGDDSLQGGFGNDTYIFNKGDGRDTIYDGYYTKGSRYEERNYSEYGDNYSAGKDNITFGKGITENDIEVIRDGNNLIVGIKEEGVEFDNLSDNIVIENWFDKKLRVESFKFEGGSKLEVGHILGLSLGDELSGFTADGASIDATGTDRHNTIETLEGNDTIDGGKGNDILSGNEGNDILMGGDGNDILYGGKGEDTLLGGKGNDTYLFNIGDGTDTIHDLYSDNGNSGNSKKNDSHNSAGVDTLKLGEDVSIEGILLKKEGSDLLIGFAEDGQSFEELDDKIIIKEEFSKNMSVENMEVSQVNYSLEKIIQLMAQIPDDGILDFSKVAEDMENEVPLGAIGEYLYKPQESI